MRNDLYLRGVLTVIAAALVYLCIVFTPLPGAHAQQPARGALRPGDDTGPAEMVIVGVRMPPGSALPVAAVTPVPVTGEVRVSGRVQTEQVANVVERVVISGWEDNGAVRNPGRFRGLRDRPPDAVEGLPVVNVR